MQPTIIDGGASAHGNLAREKQVRKVTWIGLLLNLFLSALKFLAGFYGQSQALIADAVHSLSDTTSDIAVIAGSYYWSRPPDEDHPYGHLRIEALITVIIGLTLASIAIGLTYNSLITIKEFDIKRTSLIAVLGPLISIFVKEFLYRWTLVIGKRVKSKAVIANAWHHRSDALSSIPAIIAVLIAAINPEWAYIDHIGAIIIAIFILKVSSKFGKYNGNPVSAEFSDSV